MPKGPFSDTNASTPAETTPAKRRQEEASYLLRNMRSRGIPEEGLRRMAPMPIESPNPFRPGPAPPTTGGRIDRPPGLDHGFDLPGGTFTTHHADGPPRLPFHIKWHQNVLNRGQSRSNPDGTTSTVVSGVYSDDRGRSFILPTYDPNLRSESNPSGTIANPMQRFRPEIQRGEITPYPSVAAALEAEKQSRRTWIEPNAGR